MRPRIPGCTLDSPVPWDPGEGVEDRKSRGPGTEIQLPLEKRLRLGRGAREREGSAPAPSGSGKARRPARSKQTRRGGQRGGGGRPGIGQHRAGQSWPAANVITQPLLARLPPPRAAFSIHKFSSCYRGYRAPEPAGSAAQPPARRPWAAHPGAEAGARGPGVALGRAGAGRGRMASSG